MKYDNRVHRSEKFTNYTDYTCYPICPYGPDPNDLEELRQRVAAMIPKLNVKQRRIVRVILDADKKVTIREVAKKMHCGKSSVHANISAIRTCYMSLQ